MKTTLLLFCILYGSQFTHSQTAEPFVIENPSMRSIRHFGTCNGKIIYTANGTTSNSGLWISDGTIAGTQMLKDSLISNKLIEYNGKTFFSGMFSFGDYALWATDGTAAGTQLVKNVTPVGVPFDKTMVCAIFNGKLYFSGSDGNSGYELWVTDGTTAGTSLVKDINPSGDGFPNRFMEFNGKLYFAATTPTEGEELWVTDGTTSGTIMLKDVNGNSGTYPESSPMPVKVFNNKLYFTARTDAEGRELWTTDGTANGTVLFKAFESGVAGGNPSNFTEFNGSLYFATTSSITYQRDMWKSDGTAAGTIKLLDSTISLSSANGYLYLSRKISSSYNLFKTDGNPGNILQVEPASVTHSYFPDEFIQLGGKICYSYDSASSGANYNNFNLWTTDGTSANTHRVKYLDGTNFIGHNKENIIKMGNTLYFMRSYDDPISSIYPEGIYRIVDTSSAIGIAQVKLDNSHLKLYPNPTNAILNLEISSSATSEKAIITICSLQGVVVQQKNIIIHAGNNTQAINLEGLSSGTYILKLQGKNTNLTTRFMMIE